MTCYWDYTRGITKFEWLSPRGTAKLINTVNNRFKARHYRWGSAHLPWALSDITTNINYYLSKEPALLREEYDSVEVCTELVRRAIVTDNAVLHIVGSMSFQKFWRSYVGGLEHWLIDIRYLYSFEFCEPDQDRRLLRWDNKLIESLIIGVLEKADTKMSTRRVANEVRKSAWLLPWIMDADYVAVMPSEHKIREVLRDPSNDMFVEELNHDSGRSLWTIRDDEAGIGVQQHAASY
jgi:hypothetical protein